jgi:phosphosulfolactate phosphohydrolase-like enzyme
VSVRVRIELGAEGGRAAARRGDVVVVVDTLRASSTIVAALASGMRAVVPTTSLERFLSADGVSAGERRGEKLAGFDHGNSPTEILRQSYRGKTLYLTTSNGTECIAAAAGGAEAVVIGCLLNARAVAGIAYRRASGAGRDLTLLAAGRQGGEAIEDTLSAAEIWRCLPGCPLEGAVPPCPSSDLLADLLASPAGRHLLRLGYREDVELCARKDLYDVVPVYRGGELVADGTGRS